MRSRGWTGLNAPAYWRRHSPCMIGLRLALVCLQAGDYPPESTGLECGLLGVVGNASVLVVEPPPSFKRILQTWR